MSKRKYITEFGVNSWASFMVSAQQGDFPSLDQYELDFKKHPCHIYMIGRRPRITIETPSLTYDSRTISGQYLVQNNKNFTPHSFTLHHVFGDIELTFESPFPHTILTVKKNDGTWIGTYKAPGLVHLGEEKNKHLNDLEIMYVGQSYGVDGARTAPERLQKHETLQAIYAHTAETAPDKEVWVLLFSFDCQLIALMDGTAKDYQVPITDDFLHVENVISKEISWQQIINFTEAALIRYFHPEFNKNFKDTFPNPAHSTYSECYDLDVNSVIVTLNTESISTRTWTAKIPASLNHIVNFNLHSSAERRGMFEFFGQSWL